MKMKKISYILLCIPLFWVACKDDNVEDLNNGPAPCDLEAGDTAFYSTVIQPIFNSSCGSDNNGCHDVSNSIAQGGSNGSLADYAGTIETLLDCSADGTLGSGGADLMKRVTHDSSIPSSKWMPKGTASKIGDCSIQKLQRWIDQGFQDN
ncbi:MAG: hypothetical protein RL213_1035 [Bacteroidota bacterium]|jgi:hypothetical protein